MFNANRAFGRWVDRHPRLIAVAMRVAVAHAAFCGVVLLTTALPGAPIVSPNVVVPLAIVPIFTYWFPAVGAALSVHADSGVLARASGFAMVRQVWRLTPRWTSLGAVAIFYACVGLMMATVPSAVGQPETVNDQQVLNAHGHLIRVDRTTFREQELMQ
jgi:hypothetical protein